MLCSPNVCHSHVTVGRHMITTIVEVHTGTCNQAFFVLQGTTLQGYPRISGHTLEKPVMLILNHDEHRDFSCTICFTEMMIIQISFVQRRQSRLITYCQFCMFVSINLSDCQITKRSRVFFQQPSQTCQNTQISPDLTSDPPLDHPPSLQEALEHSDWLRSRYRPDISSDIASDQISSDWSSDQHFSISVSGISISAEVSPMCRSISTTWS